MSNLEFRWSAINPGYPGAKVLYQVGLTSVARMMDRLDGSWWVILDYHLQGNRPHRNCSSFEAGQRGVEMWAERHADRLRAEVTAKHEAWMKTQTWRPTDRPPGAADETRSGHDSGHDQQTTSIPDQGRLGSGTGRRRKSSRHRSPL